MSVCHPQVLGARAQCQHHCSPVPSNMTMSHATTFALSPERNLISNLKLSPRTRSHVASHCHPDSPQSFCDARLPGRAAVTSVSTEFSSKRSKKMSCKLSPAGSRTTCFGSRADRCQPSGYACLRSRTVVPSHSGKSSG